MQGIEPVDITDDARRISDTHALHQIAEMYGHFMAVRMSDGSSDGIAYPSWKAARSHQPTFYQDRVFPVQIQREAMTADIAQRLLNYWRKCSDAGFRPPDPEEFGGQEVQPILPDKLENFS